MKKWIALCLLLLGWSTILVAEEESTVPCADPEYRQFDFWLGHWTAYDEQGKRQGTNHLHRINGQCAIQENWTGEGGGYTGKSINFYDRITGNWHQTWVDNNGGHLFLSGGIKEGKMVLSGQRKRRDGKTVVDRITWTPLRDGRVRQHWEMTMDGGESWSDVFDGFYQKDDAGS